MAPEQLAGKRIDTRCDLYSLGMVMWQMLGGKLPVISGNSTTSIYRAMKRVDTPVPSIKDIVPDVPDELCVIVDKLLQINPDERFQTAKDTFAVLDKIGAAPAEVIQEASPARRRKVSPILIAIIFILGIGGAFIFGKSLAGNRTSSPNAAYSSEEPAVKTNELHAKISEERRSKDSLRQVLSSSLVENESLKNRIDTLEHERSQARQRSRTLEGRVNDLAALVEIYKDSLALTEKPDFQIDPSGKADDKVVRDPSSNSKAPNITLDPNASGKSQNKKRP
jgi:hypothetical protein